MRADRLACGSSPARRPDRGRGRRRAAPPGPHPRPPPGERPGPRRGRLRHRHGVDRHRPVRSVQPAPPGARPGRDRTTLPPSSRRTASPSARGSGSPMPARTGRRGRGGSPSRVTARSPGRPRRGVTAAARPPLPRPADGRPLAGPARVPARPRAARGGHVVPAVAPAGGSPPAGVGPGRRGPPARRDRPGPVAARGATRDRDRGGPRHRPLDRARGARRSPRSRPVPRDRRDARCDRAARHVPRRRAATRCCATSVASCMPCRRSGARSRAASTRSARCSTRPRRGSGACAPRSGWPTTGCGGGWMRSSAPSSGNALQEPIVTLRNGRYVVPVKAEARARVKGIVHDASGSGQTLFIEPLVAVELGNAWREAQVAEQEEIARILDELSALVAANARGPARDARRAGPVRPVGGQGEPRRRHGRHARRDGRPTRGHPALGAPPGPDRHGRPHRHPDRRRLHRARRDRSQHRRQDRDPAHARAAQPDAPVRAAHPGGRRQPPAGLARRLRRHRRRAVRGAVALDVLGPPAPHHDDRRRGRSGHARPARRARCGDGSDRGLGPGPGAARPLHPGRGRSSRPRPTTPSSRPTPTRRPGRATPPSSSTSRRCRRPIASRSACPVAARRSRSPSGWGCPKPIVDGRPIAPDRGAALVRGDARRDQGDRGRDERGARPRPRSGGPGRRRAANRGTRSAAAPEANETSTSGRPASRPIASWRTCGRSSPRRVGRSSGRP